MKQAWITRITSRFPPIKVDFSFSPVFNNHHRVIKYGFAYGSGAVTQGGYDYVNKGQGGLPMIDMIFAVENSINVQSIK